MREKAQKKDTEPGFGSEKKEKEKRANDERLKGKKPERKPARAAWTPAEAAYLRAHITAPNPELAERLGRSEYSVASKKERIRVQEGIEAREARIWTQDDLDFLTENFSLSSAELAERLGRTKEAVAQRKSIMRKSGSAARNKKRRWTEEEREFLKAHMDMPAVEAAKRLSRTKAAVTCERQKMRAERKKRRKEK